jgi:hypothetical protein
VWTTDGNGRIDCSVESRGSAGVRRSCACPTIVISANKDNSSVERNDSGKLEWNSHSGPWRIVILGTPTRRLIPLGPIFGLQ